MTLAADRCLRESEPRPDFCIEQSTSLIVFDLACGIAPAQKLCGRGQRGIRRQPIEAKVHQPAANARSRGLPHFEVNIAGASGHCLFQELMQVLFGGEWVAIPMFGRLSTGLQHNPKEQ